MPSVPSWTEFTYNRTDWWKNGSQFAEVVQPPTSGDCALPQNNGPDPVIFNALACAGVSGIGDVTLQNDLVVVAKKFTFSNTLDFRSSSGPFRIWFITPDLLLSDNQPTCGGQGAFTVGNKLTISASVVAMLYTPCGIDSGNGFTWTGQMYAGTITSWNNAIFGYSGVGLPGADLGTSVITPGGSASTPAAVGTLISRRDVAG